MLDNFIFLCTKGVVYLLSKNMFEQYEKKINKILLDFIIGGSYMGDYGHRFVQNIRNFFVDAYEHLLEQWERFKEWYRE